MDGDSNQRVIVGSLVILATLAIGVALAVMRPVLVPLTLALLVTYTLAPLVDGLARLKVPRVIGLLVALSLVAGLAFLLGLLVASSVNQLSERGPEYQQRLIQMGNSLLEWVRARGLPIEETTLQERLAALPITSMILGSLNQVLASISTLLLVLVFVFFLMSGRRHDVPRSEVWVEIDRRINRYLLVKVASSTVTGLLTGLVLWAIGLDLAVVFGLLAFVLNFIPSLGSIFAVILPLPVALVQFGTSFETLLVLVIPSAIQMTIGTVIEPRIAGQALSLHPVTVLLSLIFWGILWGLPGMFLAVPVTAVIKIILDRIEATRAFGALLEGRRP
ncbi:MAG TPA: AI-2E family transporter [Myxococcota bacterium]|nr:AI-2E family transporter [Myxococcota bacterium]HQK50614.1 AI-2E family transporter [Myxococcota bacterium]